MTTCDHGSNGPYSSLNFRNDQGGWAGTICGSSSSYPLPLVSSLGLNYTVGEFYKYGVKFEDDIETLYVNNIENQRTRASYTVTINHTTELFHLQYNDGDAAQYTPCLFHYCIIEYNYITVRYCVAAKNLNTNTLGVYDVINDVFYTNYGTNTFEAGKRINKDYRN